MENLPDMDAQSPEEIERAKRYSRLRQWLTLADYSYFFILLVIFLATGISAALAAFSAGLAGPGIAGQALYLVGFITLTTVATLPLGFYTGYTVEHRFGLSNETVSGWLADESKSLVISVAIMVPLGLGAYRLLAQALDFWWLYAALLWTAFGFVLAYLAPVIIMPLFNKFDPIDDVDLKQDILELAERARVRVSDVLRTDMSKRTKKANAFFAGLGNTKRIVLGDTLLAEYSRPEILTVIGHEMGHWKLGHLRKNTAAQIVGTLAGFYLADHFLRAGVAYFNFKGLDDIAGLPLIILAFMVLGVILMPAANGLSRRFERQADAFELRLVRQPEAAISTFEKLARQNLADPSPHPLIVFLLYSHPPIAERVAMARAYEKR